MHCAPVVARPARDRPHRCSRFMQPHGLGLQVSDGSSLSDASPGPIPAGENRGKAVEAVEPQ